MEEIQIYSSYEVLNAKKVEYKKFLIHNLVKSRNMFSNMGAGIKSMFGGNIKGLTKLTAQVREEVLIEMRAAAKEIGANAIVGIKFETNELFEGMLDIVAYGTAVYAEF